MIGKAPLNLPLTTPTMKLNQNPSSQSFFLPSLVSVEKWHQLEESSVPTIQGAKEIIIEPDLL